MGSYVYAVYATRIESVGAVEVLFGTEDEARVYARGRSQEARVLATSVIRYSMGQPGSRRQVAAYRYGAESNRR